MSDVRDDGQPREPEGQAGRTLTAPPVRRPLIERLGMAGIALVLGGLFVVVAVAGFSGGELFLGFMGAVGALMTFWVGGLTLFRG